MEKSLKIEVSQNSEISVCELNMNPNISHKTAPCLNPRLYSYCISTIVSFVVSYFFFLVEICDKVDT